MNLRTLSGASLVLATALVLVTGPARAGDSWLSKARAPRLDVGDAGLMLRADSIQTIFDITISLYNDPPVADRSKYEDLIRFWADGVCEQSNGGHMLGKVRIFRNGDHRPQADVIWNASEWPRANLGGFGQSGLHVWFGDEFPNGCGTGCNLDMLSIPEGAGYTMAHEWGHYVYALFDEYPQQQGDVGPVPSIMNSQWNARGGNFRWLNHSTQDNFGNPQRSTQGRNYGKSGWQVLIQDPADDSKSGNASAQPKRVRYSALVGLEPTAADNWLKIELPGAQAACRSQLEIIWMDKLRAQFVLDVSGSMTGAPLDNAKEAGRNLVKIFPDDGTAMGLVSFSNLVNQVVPVTLVPFGGGLVKQDLDAAISALSPGGTTAMFDAANLALNNLLAFSAGQGTEASEVVFLLTDGLDNASSDTQASVTAAYQADDVPLITFGYGAFAPNGVLQQLATDTGGKFFASPIDLISVQQAFATALAAVSVVQGLKSSVLTVTAGGTVQDTFVLDSTLASAEVFAVYPGAPGLVALSLFGPGGVATGIPFDCSAVSGSTSCSASVAPTDLNAFGTGTWTVEATGPSNLEVQLSAFAQPAAGHPYHVHLGSPTGQSLSYPEPLFVTAAVGEELPITGVTVTAELTDPNGMTTALPMNDAGTDGDATADDGVYTAIAQYTLNGTYTVVVRVDNGGGTAQFTREGLEKTPAEDGTEPEPPPLPPIDENFTRTSQFQVQVEGVGLDDHPDSGPGTALASDNQDAAGMIDGAGDTDCFTVQVLDPASDLVVRVTELGLAMEPLLEVFDSTGSTLLAASDPENDVSVNGYVFVNVPSELLPGGGEVLACVSHRDPDAGQGIYRLSAGTPIVSDVTPQQSVIEIPTLDRVGGGFLVLLLAALGGFVLRRLG